MALNQRQPLLRLLLILLTFVLILDVSASESAEDAVHEASNLLDSVRATSHRVAPGKRGGVGVTKSFLTTLFLSGPPSSASHEGKPISPPLSKAIQLLETAAHSNQPDALFMLAEINMFGNFSHPRNYTEAFRRYQQLATLNGNSSAQHMLGFMYATGIGGAVPQDQARAMLYFSFAAEGEDGDIRSQMAIAYRHHSGIATPRNCEEGVHYYQKVADKVIAYIRSGPPGNHMVIKDAYRIADEDGGIYGEGASVSSAGPNAKLGGTTSDAHASIEDVVEYLDLMSKKGDIKAKLQLGKLYYEGTREMSRDPRLAKHYFLKVAREVWPKKGKMRSDVSPSTEKYASKAAGFLGRMFLRGEGMTQDFELAQVWFKRGVANGDALSQYSLGIMHLHGYGVSRDPVKAAEYFAPAADQDLASAQTRLGALFLDQGDVSTAIRYFDLAARHGHIEAYYYLAELSHQGIGRDKSCTMASMYYKIVAEKAEAILASFKEANDAYDAGDVETALVDYMLAAEQGFETAQANVAYLLDKAIPRYSLPPLITIKKSKSLVAPNSALALLYWSRSAKQANIDSLVKMGDYYLEGQGTTPDREKAAACYQAAAETHQSAQAYWNLGWMHENGIGIEQDFHLAKRYYDHALETNKEAFLPVTLALFKLRARSFWNTITNGNVKSIQNEHAPRKSWTEWLNAFIEAGAANFKDEQQYELDDWENIDPMPGGDESFYTDGDLDDGILESLAIIALAVALMFLVVYRRRNGDQRVANDGGANGAQAGGQERLQADGGLFPQPDDPEFPGWAVGGVGH